MAVSDTHTVADALEHARSLVSKHPSAAAAQAREVLRVEPGIAEAHILLALALRATGNAREAEAAESQAISIATQDPVILKAYDQIAVGAVQEADELLNFYLADTPNDPVAVYFRATIQERLGDRAGARSLLQRAVSLAPGYGEARRELERLDKLESTFADAQLPPKPEEGHELPGEWFTGSPSEAARTIPGEG